jgi:peptidoglycan-associated lipoprotein
MPSKEWNDMKTWRFIQMTLVMLVLLGLAAGCASTPSATDADGQGQVAETDVTQQQDVSGIKDQGIRDEQVPDHQAVRGLERVQYEFDQFTLTDEARMILGQNAEYLKANGAVQVVIEGHCDDRGSDEYNLALGERRAMAAKKYLVSLGISGKRLSTISYGEEKPLDSRSNEQAWAANRRAEFKAVQ